MWTCNEIKCNYKRHLLINGACFYWKRIHLGAVTGTPLLVWATSHHPVLEFFLLSDLLFTWYTTGPAVKAKWSNQESIQVPLPHRHQKHSPTWSWISSNTPGTLYRSARDWFILSSITRKWVNTWEQKARGPDVCNFDPFISIMRIWVLQKTHCLAGTNLFSMNLGGYFPLSTEFHLLTCFIMTHELTACFW